MFKFSKIVLYIAVITLCFIPVVVWGQDVSGGSDNMSTVGSLFGLDVIDQGLNLGDADLFTIVVRIINVGLGFLGIIAVIMFILSGFRWVLAGGQEEKVSAARRTFVNTIIGLIIILSANSIVLFLLRSLSQNTNTGPQF